jgi:hypothetical protein
VETEFKTLANKVINSKNIKSRRKLLIFSLCLTVALFFWLLIKFSKNYQLTVDCPVSFVNLPHERVLMNNADTTLKITIKSKGFNLLYYQIFKHKIHFNIDASQLKLSDIQNDSISYIGAAQFSKIFNRQLNFDFEILNIQPDTFALHWEKAYFKKLPVKPNLVLNFAKQYQLYDSIRIQPDSILVSGTKSDISKIAFLNCKRTTLNNLSASQVAEADILLPANLSKLKLFTQKVKINISVEKFTEAEMEIEVKPSENNNLKNIKLFPEKVKITYLVALKDFKKVNRESIEADADINTSSNNLSASVHLTKFPSFIKISKIYPERLEYIIFK